MLSDPLEFLHVVFKHSEDSIVVFDQACDKETADIRLETVGVLRLKPGCANASVRFERKAENEFAALARAGAASFNRPAVQLDDGFDNRETNS